MDRETSVSALSMQVSAACLLCTLVYWFSGTGWREGSIYPLILLLYAPALYVANRLFLRRERTMRSLVILNSVVGLLFFAALVPMVWWGGWGAVALAAVGCLWLTGWGAQMAAQPPALSKQILFLDISLVVLILYVSYASAFGSPVYQLIPACVGCACALLGLMVRRLGGGLGMRGWGFIAGAFLIVLALVFLLVGAAAAPAGQGVVALWNALTAAVQFVLDQLWRLLVWISSLLPEPEAGEPMEMDPIQIELPQEGEYAETSPIMLGVMASGLMAGVIFLLICCMRALGRIRVGGRTAARRTASRRRIPLLAGLRRMLSGWAAALRLRLYLFRIRETPEGAYYLLVRRCRMAPWHKRRGETPREFLLRLRAAAGEDRQLADALDALIPAVDRALYAPGGGGERFAQGGLIRRRAGASARRQLLRDLLSHLPLFSGGAAQKSG